MQIWSSNPVSFALNTTYDFSTALTQAFSNGINNPLRYMGNGVYAMWAGDVNQDGAVGVSDMAIIDNDAALFRYGYIISDCTGDGVADGSDMSVTENNSQLNLFYGKP